METLKFYKFSTLALLILNVCVLGFTLFSSPKPSNEHPKKADLKTEIISIFDFNAAQQESFITLAKEHHQSIIEIEERQTKLVSDYFSHLLSTPEETEKETCLNNLKQLEEEKLEVTYQHFSQIKSLLNDKQHPHFQEFMNKVITKILGSDKKKPGPPKGLR